MLGFPSSAESRRHPARLLLVGLFATLLHLLAGSGMVRAGVAGPDGFVPDVCSSHGGVKPGTADDLPQGGHDCCKLCAAGGPPLLAATAVAAALTPTWFGWVAHAESEAPNVAPASTHRPRGPPQAD